MESKATPGGKFITEICTGRMPVSVGRDWTPDETKASVTKGPHSSALEDDEISQIQVEVWEKSARGFATIVRWDNRKHNPPSILKISLLAIITHKIRK